jgi:hypothetical protein
MNIPQQTSRFSGKMLFWGQTKFQLPNPLQALQIFAIGQKMTEILAHNIKSEQNL